MDGGGKSWGRVAATGALLGEIVHQARRACHSLLMIADGRTSMGSLHPGRGGLETAAAPAPVTRR
jgi:hypothetical protein